MNYTWNINTITKKTINGIDDVIFRVVWQKYGIDSDGYSGFYKVSTNLRVSNIDATNFIPYENLKEEDIINWIKSLIDEEEIDEYIENEIQRARNKEIQIESGDFPWQLQGGI